MTQIWLATNGGHEHIGPVLASGKVRIDRLEVGDWMDHAQLSATVAQGPVLLHTLSDGIIWPRGRRWAAQRARLVRQTNAPWFSVHLDIGWPFLAYRWPGPTPIRPALGKRWAVRSVQRLQAECKASGCGRTQVLVENMPRWTHSMPAYIVDPAFITGVVEEAGCGLLLDLGHVRVVARFHGEPVHDYLVRLPLDRTVEIHVSGPRPLQSGAAAGHGWLYDAHEPMQEEDYSLLQWTLERCMPQVVTLEYWRDRAQLEAQLQRLRALLDGYASPPDSPIS